MSHCNFLSYVVQKLSVQHIYLQYFPSTTSHLPFPGGLIYVKSQTSPMAVLKCSEWRLCAAGLCQPPQSPV